MDRRRRRRLSNAIRRRASRTSKSVRTTASIEQAMITVTDMISPIVQSGNRSRWWQSLSSGNQGNMPRFPPIFSSAPSQVAMRRGLGMPRPAAPAQEGPARAGRGMSRIVVRRLSAWTVSRAVHRGIAATIRRTPVSFEKSFRRSSRTALPRRPCCGRRPRVRRSSDPAD